MRVDEHLQVDEKTRSSGHRQGEQEDNVLSCEIYNKNGARYQHFLSDFLASLRAGDGHSEHQDEQLVQLKEVALACKSARAVFNQLCEDQHNF